MEKYHVKKLWFGKDRQLEFEDDKQYYYVVGILCNNEIFHISFEENAKTNSYTDAYRIRSKVSKERLPSPLQNAIRSGNRINNNEFIRVLIDKHYFAFDEENKLIVGSYDTVIQSIPDQYVEAFNEGYRLYRDMNRNKEPEVLKADTFSEYSIADITDAKSDIIEGDTSVITVFISHKHEDLDSLKNILGFFEKEYGVKVYIDSRDMDMPDVTSGETAQRIKERINACNKFVLLATDKAIESKWCNWELGYGDAQKYYGQDLALFPLGEDNEEYKGNEYLSIYPHIVRNKNFPKDSNDKYNVSIPAKDGTVVIITLKEWFENSLKKDGKEEGER